jgi:hypothetical protein
VNGLVGICHHSPVKMFELIIFGYTDLPGVISGQNLRKGPHKVITSRDLLALFEVRGADY